MRIKSAKNLVPGDLFVTHLTDLPRYDVVETTPKDDPHYIGTILATCRAGIGQVPDGTPPWTFWCMADDPVYVFDGALIYVDGTCV